MNSKRTTTGAYQPSSGNQDGLNWDAPPAYKFEGHSNDGSVSAKITDDGRFNIGVKTKLSAIPGYDIEKLVTNQTPQRVVANTPGRVPPLNIVIQIVGSRGDVQPFIALGQRLQSSGHRIRIATHGEFEDFVRSTGLEFYNIGGNASHLMAYMVKNPSIFPSFATMKSGEIGRKRKMVYEMLNGCWRSCIMPDAQTEIPFVADAIIANPPSFAHVHCAQALGVPVHLMFTMPWSPTKAFPHPLANMQTEESDPQTANFMSYRIVDVMTWQGLGDVINLWRKKTLGLDAVANMVAPRLAEILQVPFTYCWSPALVPKPSDWPSYIDVCGFFFREEKPYTPDRELDAFLRAGPRPIYIGFGSIVMENPENMTDLIISAVKACRVRAIVSKGWSKLGAGRSDKDILFLGDCPHEWLFKHVAGVIHHGGAGTTACGLLNGRPTGIVPFFGDQPFWGNMVAVAGAGPKPIHHKELNSENLAAMIRKCLEPATLQAAADIARRMSHERGVDAAAESFFRNLPAQAMTCDIINGQKASWVWSDEQSNKLKLSDLALHTLVEHGKIKIEDTNVYEPYPITIENQRWDPLTASGSAIMGAAVDVSTAVSGLFFGLKSEFKQSNGSRDESGDRRAARVAIKTSRSVAEIGGVAVKASLVDYPMALVDGLDGIPALLGGKTRRFEPVTDWRSGGRVACKKFGMGFVDAFANLAMHPIRGAKNEGFAGFMKGIPAGAFGFVTTPAAGIFGLVAYPAQGVYKSIKTMYNPDRQEILFARQVHGAYLNTRYKLGPEQVAIVLSAFDATRATLRRGRKKNKK
ncbi:glycosyltransferase family 1 protein [Aureobasidium pullulans]|uniref:Glycosyltransferase family 1 protein n=1 Tax=Aureobasidium pullulans TaxID=5580 RepID=A0A4S9VNK1_AURPU|nr:glycosyltransferase family 1 protein [Aureobasidium pullulans]